jgi:hypothetical protein
MAKAKAKAKTKAKAKSKTMTKTKAKTTAKARPKAKTAVKGKTKSKAKAKAKPAARPVAARPTSLVARDAKTAIGKRRATTPPADEVRLRVTDPVRLTPAQRPMSLMREMPTHKVKS